MSDTDTRTGRRTLTILADEYFKKNDYHKALELYKKAKNDQKLRFHGRNFANRRYFDFAAKYLKAAECKLENEKLAEYLDNYFRMGKYFHIIEPLALMEAKEKLANYADICMEKNEVLTATIYYDAAGIKITNEMLTLEQIRRLVEEADEYAALENNPRHAVRAYRIARAYIKLLGLSLMCLERSALTEAIEIYNIVATEALLLSEVWGQYKQIASSFANRYLVQGDYAEGMRLYRAIEIRPNRAELITCGNMGFLCEPMFGRVFNNAMKAFRRAGATPSKKRIKDAGDHYLENHMIFQAIDAFEAAEDTERLWLIMEKYAKREYCGSFDNEIMEKIARSIAKVEDKISRRKNR